MLSPTAICCSACITTARATTTMQPSSELRTHRLENRSCDRMRGTIGNCVSFTVPRRVLPGISLILDISYHYDKTVPCLCDNGVTQRIQTGQKVRWARRSWPNMESDSEIMHHTYFVETARAVYSPQEVDRLEKPKRRVTHRFRDGKQDFSCTVQKQLKNCPTLWRSSANIYIFSESNEYRYRQ